MEPLGVSHLGTFFSPKMGAFPKVLQFNFGEPWKVGGIPDYVTGELDPESNPILEDEMRRFYRTAKLLEREPKLREKFIYLYMESHIWLRYTFNGKSIIMTHSPCREIHLGADDEISRDRMVKCESRSKNRGVKLDRLLHYLIDEAKDGGELHIFGHLSQPNIRIYRNKICIDTASIYGNMLSCAILSRGEVNFDSVEFMNLQKPAKQKYNLLFDFK